MRVRVTPGPARQLEPLHTVHRALETQPHTDLVKLTVAIYAGQALDAHYTGRPAAVLDYQTARNAVGALRAQGKIELWQRRHQPPLYRVTAFGKAWVILHWRERLHHARTGVASLRRLAADLASVLPLAGQPVETLDLAYFGLSVNTVKRLAAAGVGTVGSLAEWSKEELLGLKGVGRKTVDEVEMELASVGLEMGC